MASNLKIEFTGLKELMESMEKLSNREAVVRAVEASVKQRGAELQQKAQYYVPVDTGHLRRSIELWIERDGGDISANVEPKADYATYVEYGTRFMSSQPYMRPAFNDVSPKFLVDMEQIVKRLLASKGGGL